ncbi:NosR/NirI family protein [Halomonas sp. PGE1]|uniref:transcriptional regulator NosR n=1 Tax=Halomonas sp. PGE1 TaxID=2730360 RepID=UPI0020161543|nr:NosR/NirI family protein [Halomonas sp. PGE1]
MTSFLRPWLVTLALLMAVVLSNAALTTPAQAAEWLPVVFPEADAVGEPIEEPPVLPVLRDGETVGYVFETNDIAPIPAYSGHPVNMRVGMALDGRITGVEVLDHSEPIMLVGIPETVLDDFVGQYAGKSVRQKVRVGLSRQQREGYEQVDAVSGATVTVVVMGEGIMRSARRVARELGILEGGVAERATVREDHFEEASWEALLAEGAIGHLQLTRGEVDEAFIGTAAEGVEAAPEGREEETFIDLYFAYLNVPTVGRNLLGERQFEQLMAGLGEDEHALAIMANGRYSFKGSGFVRGGIYDRIMIHHGGRTDQFHDADMRRLWGVEAEGAPRFAERDIFILREETRFDPGQAWELELLVRRQVGALDTEFAGFDAELKVPERFLVIPEPVADAMLDDETRPLWVSVWEDRVMHIVVLGAGLVLLTFILLFQDWLARRPRLLHTIRYSFLVYTVVFIGWYALAQLSVVNVLTFANALFTDFQWSTFLMDPMMFILWSFVAVTLLLWGRGVYCGWLCPFGAMQELISAVALKFKVPQFELPFAVHERLWALKYIILLGLFALSLQSLGQAEIYAEVEPFKTAVLLKFQREWGFVLYAVLLLVISAFNHKFYCRYVCPLGAGLAIPARIRLFDWLRRHKECGKPCQICANECHIQAIHPDGRINPNECHYCLDCQVTYHNDRKCPPMVVQRKKREKATRLSSKVAESRRIPAAEVSGDGA